MMMPVFMAAFAVVTVFVLMFVAAFAVMTVVVPMFVAAFAVMMMFVPMFVPTAVHFLFEPLHVVR